MPDTLILRFASRNEPLDWVVVDAAGQISEAFSGSLAEAANAARNCKLIALAPSDSVLRINANIPLKGVAKIRQALPFALEEQIASDIDTQHFAFSKADSNGNIPVAVVENTLLTNWLDQLAAAGLKADSFRVANDGLPAMPATVSILIENSTVTIRDYLGEYIVSDTDSLPLVLDMLLDKHSETMENDASVVPVNIIAYCTAESHEHFSELWQRLRLRAETVETKILTSGALPFLAAQLITQDGVNLLQGRFKPTTQLNIKWGPWRVPAVLLAACFVLALCIEGLNFWQLTVAEASLDKAASQVLQETFPDAGSSADPWGALQSRLGAGTSDTTTVSGPGFDEIISTLATAFATTPDLRMQTMAFRNGVLDLQLLAPDVSALDKLRQQISDSGGFAAAIQSANPDKDVIKGRMQITAVAE
jgi:general secretion pathway protein L